MNNWICCLRVNLLSLFSLSFWLLCVPISVCKLNTLWGNGEIAAKHSVDCAKKKNMRVKNKMKTRIAMSFLQLLQSARIFFFFCLVFGYPMTLASEMSLEGTSLSPTTICTFVIERNFSFAILRHLFLFFCSIVFDVSQRDIRTAHYIWSLPIWKKKQPQTCVCWKNGKNRVIIVKNVVKKKSLLFWSVLSFIRCIPEEVENFKWWVAFSLS